MITIRFKSIKTYDNIFKLKTEDDEDDLEIYSTLHDLDQGFDHLYSIRSFLPCFLGGRFPCSSVLFRVLLGLLVGFTAFAAVARYSVLFRFLQFPIKWHTFFHFRGQSEFTVLHLKDHAKKIHIPIH